MANTKSTFLRRFEVFARISSSKKTILSEPLAITLGFTGDVDPESGMILNLSQIDGWIRDFAATLAKKTYSNRWMLCRSVRNQFHKLIAPIDLSEIRFDFHDLNIEFNDGDVFIKWHRHSTLQWKETKWISPITLTMKASTKKWPPLSPLLENKINQSLKSVKLGKSKWDVAGLTVSSFEYVDPKLGIRVRV